MPPLKPSQTGKEMSQDRRQGGEDLAAGRQEFPGQQHGRRALERRRTDSVAAAAHFLPVRSTLVAPILPEPILRTSPAPEAQAKNSPNGIDAQQIAQGQGCERKAGNSRSSPATIGSFQRQIYRPERLRRGAKTRIRRRQKSSGRGPGICGPQRRCCGRANAACRVIHDKGFVGVDQHQVGGRALGQRAGGQARGCRAGVAVMAASTWERPAWPSWIKAERRGQQRLQPHRAERRPRQKSGAWCRRLAAHGWRRSHR